MNITAMIYAVVVFLVVILLLVAILLIAKRYLVSSGNVKVIINGDKEYDVAAGGSLLLMGLLSALLTARGGPSSWGYVSQALLFHQVQGAGRGSVGPAGEGKRRVGNTPAPGRPRVDSHPS